MHEHMSVVFMGTPDFAVPALERLHRSPITIELVVTQPDRPKGRGKKLSPPPVKQVAESLGYTVIQPVSVKTQDIIDRLAEIKPDAIVVVAFGHFLPRAVLDIPRWGAINIHPSLLPKYRGPAPIQHAISNGEQETGVTIMRLDTGMDTGDILSQETAIIDPLDTSESLHARLAEEGADLLVRTLDGLAQNTITPVKQDHESATLAPRLNKKDGRIDWRDSAENIDCFVRGMHPWPGAFTHLNDKRLKVFKVQPVEGEADHPPGTVVTCTKKDLVVCTGNGWIKIVEIQGASGKRMGSADFLRGHAVTRGTLLS